MKEHIEIQSQLHVPKNKFNAFGKYNYRSAENILEALKPLLFASDCSLTLSEEIVVIDGRVYVKSTATLTNKDCASVSCSSYAREAMAKKGMDESQITGAATSYARKYALGGLLAIDDGQDADCEDNRPVKPSNGSNATKSKYLSKEDVDGAIAWCDNNGVPVEKLCSLLNVQKLSEVKEESKESIRNYMKTYKKYNN